LVIFINRRLIWIPKNIKTLPDVDMACWAHVNILQYIRYAIETPRLVRA